ncbi:ABC transporter substrate-binding protein [Bradyrhizobium sp. KBS0727]|uniref:ABC transporter substrate-binding protein n=1 Tax=unclassified Bradyrhizobium TaxID=2631580 RepID=UPI00110EDC32|nr:MULTISPECIES: ABC transporter substrate-binding protein [unclassified Bradyrhizobium]QDW39344.1 ABC transporter substrate-binding protein [Bradyrhizobium sp. KBS0725]QDW45947.1 ABC transporter substrate-binding protein [Bradyrhizobium sp. KBS0727]
MNQYILVDKGDLMRRRDLVAGLASAAITWPFSAIAQSAVPRVGILFAGSEGSATSNGFIAEISEGLRNLGLNEGRDYVFEKRFAAGDYARFPALAAELALAGARIVLPNTIAAARAAQALSPPLPVVLVAINDPVGTGLIASLARPGGHTTGVATLIEDLTPKMLEYQRMLVPEAKVLGIISNPANPSNPIMVDNFRAHASAMGMTVRSVSLSLPGEIDATFASLAAAKPDALHLIGDAANVDLGDRLSAFANAQRIPLFSTYPPMVEFGCLLAYGPPRRMLLVRVGYYVKRILEGSAPADLPVEQPTQIELWLNKKAADALGLTVPASLLATADKVIE